MHSNELINVKARCETMHKVRLEDRVACEDKECAFKELIMAAEDNGEALFLAAKQGAEKIAMMQI